MSVDLKIFSAFLCLFASHKQNQLFIDRNADVFGPRDADDNALDAFLRAENGARRVDGAQIVAH